MNSKAVRAFVALIFLSSCGKLTPEKQKKITPDIVFQSINSQILHDETTGRWSYWAYFEKRLESSAGAYAALSAGESVVMNGTELRKTGTDKNVNYWLSGTDQPDQSLVYVWTASDGNIYTNQCGWRDFQANNFPSTLSKSGGLVLEGNVPEATGHFGGSISQTIDSMSTLYVNGKGQRTEDSITGTVTFSASSLADLQVGEAELSFTWSEQRALTEFTSKGGSCYISMTHRRKVTIVE